MLTYVLAKDGTPLMPTYNIRKVRRMLKCGSAEIAGYRPGFTIRLLYDSGRNIQPVELCEDTGYQTAGVSVKSEKHEFAHEEYTFLKDEKQRHDDRRQCRRQRRSRKRYRAPRFDNRKHSKPDGWIAPSLKNKADRHADIVAAYRKVLPITAVHLEVGSFDTQLLEAIETGGKIPEGTDYQMGPRYGCATLREAVFFRDNYTCICCGKSAIRDNVVLRTHHLGFRKNDHSDRLRNLATVCSKCHTPKNHKPGGKLYDLNPKLRPLTGAAFMNAVRNYICEEVERRNPGVEVCRTYGAMTKLIRNGIHIAKTHANDAYCIGSFRPKHRAKTVSLQKRRRCNRILEKFRDARIIDIRDSKKKTGSELSCNRTDRSVPRNNSQNERCFRGEKVAKGKRLIRRQRYAIRPGDIVEFSGESYTVIGVQNKGAYISVVGRTPIPARDTNVIIHAGSWQRTA